MQQFIKKGKSWWTHYKGHVRQIILSNAQDRPGQVSYWRNTVFCEILTYLTPLSIIALIPSVIMAFLNGAPVVGITDLVAFAAVVLITLSPGIRLDIRKAIFILILYSISVTLLYFLPLPGPGFMFLLSATIFSSLIYSPSAAYISTWINTFICFCFALLIYFDIKTPVTSTYELGPWLAISSNLILLGFACAKCLDLLITGLTASLKNNRIYEEKLEKSNRLFQFISQINQTIVHVKDAETLFRKACAIAIAYGNYKMAWIGQFDLSQNKISLLNSGGISDQDLQLFTDVIFEPDGPQDYVLSKGTYFLCNNIENATELENWKPYAAKHNIRSCIILPIINSGTIFGTFNLYSSELNNFDKDHVALLLEVTGDISFALEIFDKTKRQLEADEIIIKKDKLFRVLTEKSQDMKTLATVDGKLIYTSPSVTKILGYTIEEFSNVSAFNLIHPDDISEIGEKIQSILADPGKSFFSQHRLLHKNGKWIWCEATFTNMLHEPGIEALVSNFRDISQKREAEIELQRNFSEMEAVYNEQSALLNTLPASIALLDNKGNIVKVNDEWIHFGEANGLHHAYPHLNNNYIEICENSVGKNSKEGKLMSQGLQDVLKGAREYFALEYPCDSPSEKRWFKAEVRPFKSNNKAGAVVMHINISERKRAETEMLLLINNTEESFILLNTNLQILSFNNQFKLLYSKYFGVEIQKGNSILDYAQPERLEVVREIYKKVLKGKVVNSEIKIPFIDNTFKYFSIKYNPAKDESGGVFGVFVTASDITEKKKAEEQKEFERRNKEALINSTDDLIWSLSKEFKLIAANSPFINELKKYTGVEIQTGSDLLDQNMFSADYLIYWKQLYNRAQTGESFKIEIYTPQAPGRDESWTETSFSPIIINEQITGCACYSRNITERKKSELLIRANEARLAEAQSIAKMGNWETDLLNSGVIWSNQTYKIFDCSPDDFDSSHAGFLSFVHPDDRDKVNDAFNNSLTQKSVSSIEHRIITKSGKVRFLEEHWQVFHDSNDIPVKAIGTCQDITERKKADHENKFKAVLLDTIGQAVMATDLNGNVTFWNRAAVDIYGWSFDEAFGNKIIDLTPSFQTIADADLLMQKLSQGESWSGEFYVKRKNGSVFPAFVSNSPVYDEYGKQIGIIGVSNDISERKESEQERTKITSDLLQRNRDLEQFTFIVSHNLRAPTANIIGFTEFLQNKSLTPNEQNEFLQGLATSVSRLDTVIKDINSILQVKREVHEKRELISFSKLVDDIFISIGNLIDKSSVHIQHDFSAVDEIFSLKVYMHSIFYNLISNSIKYRRPDEKPIIEIMSKLDNGKIILTFKDNGLGIDMKSKSDKVFGLYNRFHSHVEGKGMGLFMVKTQVEAIGGKISVSSELNKGTEFTIVFENAK